MEVDRSELADEIEPTNTVLKLSGVERQIPQDEVLRKLEVATLGPHFAGNQQRRAVRVGKPGCVAIALQQAHVLVKARNRDPRAQSQRFLQRLYFGPRMTQQQGLARQIGRAHVRTPDTNANLVCRLLFEKKK